MHIMTCNICGCKKDKNIVHIGFGPRDMTHHFAIPTIPTSLIYQRILLPPPPPPSPPLPSPPNNLPFSVVSPTPFPHHPPLVPYPQNSSSLPPHSSLPMAFSPLYLLQTLPASSESQGHLPQPQARFSRPGSEALPRPALSFKANLRPNVLDANSEKFIG